MSILDYDPKTGLCHWKYRHDISEIGNRKMCGKVAGRADKHGYIEIRIFGKIFLAHRLVYLFIKGKIPKRIDHRDGNEGNNRWKNIRPCTRSQNAMNQKPLRSNNTSGQRGVNWHKISQSWVARIGFNGKRKTLIITKDYDKAVEVYKQAQLKYHGAFARLK